MHPILQGMRKFVEIAFTCAAGTLMLSIPGAVMHYTSAKDFQPASKTIQASVEGEPQKFFSASSESVAETLTEPTTEAPTEETTEAFTEAVFPEPKMMVLDVPYYAQRDLGMPTGCELVSAKMVLDYYCPEEVPMGGLIVNVRCDKPEEIDGETCAKHPSQAFIGHPSLSSSFGCFAPVIVNLMNLYLPEGYEAVDVTDKPLDELENYISQGIPVLVWATIDMSPTFESIGWYLKDDKGGKTDEWYFWKSNEHCLVLTGYDDTYYYFNDPNSWTSNTRYEKDLVKLRHEEVGNYSVVVLPKNR
ncbi:MAG TPA: hypothetical protein DCO72_00495 [Ruminococcus sp.]|nr:hypothetical protein [Ruminococcus sp.]